MVALPPAVTELGLKLTVTPAGVPDADRLTDCALPDVTAVVTVAVVEPPAVTEPEDGDSDTEKSFWVPPPGSEAKCGATVLAKLLPLEASQLTDQSIAPRIEGQVVDGWKLPQFVPMDRQSRALFTTVGDTKPPPAAKVDAGSPSPTWSGRNPFCNWMHASAVRKFSVPSLYTWPSQPFIDPEL